MSDPGPRATRVDVSEDPVMVELSEERRDQIIRLLRTRNDHLPEPRHRETAPSGFVHRTRTVVSCPDCLANGRAMPGCETCRGRGYTEERQERDPYAIDHTLPYGFDRDRHEAARDRDRQIEILDQQLARPANTEEELADANAHPFAWEQARARMWRLYDYAALDAALEQLRVRDQVAHRAIHRFYVDDVTPLWVATPASEAACEYGLRFLHRQLPADLRAPEPPPEAHVRGPIGQLAAGTGTRELRDLELRQKAAGGADPAELAREFRVSLRTVYRAITT